VIFAELLQATEYSERREWGVECGHKATTPQPEESKEHRRRNGIKLSDSEKLNSAKKRVSPPNLAKV